MVVGDYDIDVGVFQRSALCRRVGGVIPLSDVERACLGGAGNSHVDFPMASESCVPCIHSVSAVVDAPWAPRVGPELKLRGSGEQLLMRSLVVAARLPQVPRPSACAVASSKSSAKRGEMAEREANRSTV